MMFGKTLNIHKKIQKTSKGSDQTMRMRRLVLAIAGPTYLIVGNLMLPLKFYLAEILVTTEIQRHGRYGCVVLQ